MTDGGTEKETGHLPSDVRPAEQSDERPAEAGPVADSEKPKPARRERRRTLLVALVAILVLGILGLASLSFVLPYLQPVAPVTLTDTGSDAALARLEARLAALEQRPVPPPAPETTAAIPPELTAAVAANAQAIEALQRRLAESGGAATVDPALVARLDRLERELARAPAEFGSAALARIEELAERVAGLERRLQQSAEAMPRIEALERRLQQSAEALPRIEALERRLTDQGQQLALATEQLGRLREAAAGAGDDQRRVALALALNQLRDAVRRSTGFLPELKAVQALADPGASPEAIAVLQRQAETGVPSLPALQSRFSAVAAEVARAATAPAGERWWERALGRVASAVTIRRTGEVEGAEPDAVVARAEARLEMGDLTGTVAELESLTGASAEAAKEWLDQARSRLAVERAIAELQASALAGVGSAARAVR